jgi:hypothetical protein
LVLCALTPLRGSPRVGELASSDEYCREIGKPYTKKFHPVGDYQSPWFISQSPLFIRELRCNGKKKLPLKW